ncbi:MULTISPECIES: site-specific integrase [Pseudomonadota]|jgi:integrase|uniref:site-specific integrase n=1 Tax=Pseudomonadota TaxID=1224 RepID=UPI000DAFE139|nr:MULTISPECIES: site-specific integrase [Pseudomonadota]MDH6264549.1 integrase [Bradyrhizobium sp. BR13661]PZR38690.1 MAG: site-specific integrase [Paraburkholderia fungorum]
MSIAAQNIDQDRLETAIAAAVRSLPPLPPLVRYHDDFADKLHAIRDLSEASFITVEFDGKRQRINFDGYGSASPIIKLVLADWFARLDLHTVVVSANQLETYVRDRGLASLMMLVALPIFEARSHWNVFAKPNATPGQAGALRRTLHSLCSLSIGHWNPASAPLVRALRSPKVDLYRAVRSGECFLPLDHQAAIVDHIDEVCALLSKSSEAVDSVQLRDACILVIAYQYAFRPGQIARIEVADVRVFSTGAVHVAVIAAKQRDKKQRNRVTRRIKREWAPLFVELCRRREHRDLGANPETPERLLFRLTPGEISEILTELCEDLTDESWTPTDLRHTAAQRLADAGVAHIALTEFMVHASYRTANIYFDTSPTQAQRVNQAMAISPIYANVAKIARTRIIDKETLLRLPADKQIGGVPHGIPIAGIGGCEVGQSLCSKNPVLSCYTCRRFMPLRDTNIHERVLEDLRPVVLDFAASSRSNEQSPAFVQLRTTLDGVRRVVEGLKAEDPDQ